MRSQTVLILGGGVGGVVTANALRRNLERRHRIVLVNREPSFAFASSFLWVMTGDRRPEQITRPLSRLERKGIEVVQGEVERIHPDRREAIVDGRTLTADHLVVALGARFASEAIPGLLEFGHTFVTLEGAVALREVLLNVRSGRILVLTAAPAYKCPAAHYEAAMLIDAGLRRRGVRGAVEIEVHSAEPGPMAVAGPEASAAVTQMLKQKGISYYPGHQVARVEGRQVVFADGASRETDLLVYMPPIVPQDALRNSGLEEAAGWARVDRHTLETQFPGVYALGDMVLVPLAMGKPLPRAGVFAHGQAEAVARNIADRVAGRPATTQFSGHGSCFIESGGRRAGFGSGNFYAEPRPLVRMYRPSLFWHAGKVLFEKQVMWRWL